LPDLDSNLHGSITDGTNIALILIDVINDMEFPEGQDLLEYALPMARRIAALKRRAKAHRIPAIYVNDNFGQWRADFHRIVHHVLDNDVSGRPIAELLRPDEDDYFVLKPKHSGFFMTPLELLLEDLGVRTLIIAGVATNICVLFTANDAYMRNLRIIVPEDCVAANTEADNQFALNQIRNVLKGGTQPSNELNLEHLIAMERENVES